jgi:hypothetical protein
MQPVSVPGRGAGVVPVEQRPLGSIMQPVSATVPGRGAGVAPLAQRPFGSIRQPSSPQRLWRRRQARSRRLEAAGAAAWADLGFWALAAEAHGARRPAQRRRGRARRRREREGMAGSWREGSAVASIGHRGRLSKEKVYQVNIPDAGDWRWRP